MSKKAKWEIGGGVILAAIAVFVILQFIVPSNGTVPAHFGVPSVQAAEPIGHIGDGPGALAVEKAGKADKYVYALFLRDENDQTARARSLIESARKKISRKSETIEIKVTDPAEQDIVNKFGASRAPMPLVLVLAPNGAIMGGFPAYQLNDDVKLVDAVGSKGSEQALKALQQKNMVALCVQNKRTADNAGAMRTVEDFLKDPKYGSTTAVVTVDPSVELEAKFLSKLGIDPKTAIATTVLLAPPGSVIGTFQGATSQDKLVAAVKAAAAPKAGGCCPPGSGKSCGPTGAPATPQKTMTTGQPSATPVPMQIHKTPTATVPSPSSVSAASASKTPATSTTSNSTKQGK